MCCVDTAMKAITNRLTGAMLVLASIFCSADSNGVAAEEFGSISPGPGLCPAAAPSLADPLSATRWNGWGVDISQRRFQPGEMAQLAAEDVPRLKLKWAFGFPGADFAFAQPTVMGGQIFVGSRGGKVYSLDANTGCTYWEFDAGVPVRSSITIGPDSVGWLAHFGDQRGNVRAVDVVTGKALWTTLIEDHQAALLTGSPTLVGTTLFVPVSSREEVAAANPRY